MKKILVGIDGSVLSMRALQVAGRLAERMQAKLIVANVLLPRLGVEYQRGGGASMLGAELLAQLENNHLEEAQERLTDALRSLGLSPQPDAALILRGSPAEALCDAAAQQNVWMVVVGRHSQNPLRQCVLGNVADRVAQLCAKPVLVVP